MNKYKSESMPLIPTAFGVNYSNDNMKTLHLNVQYHNVHFHIHDTIRK